MDYLNSVQKNYTQLIAHVRGSSPFSGIQSATQGNGLHSSRLSFVPAYSSPVISLRFLTISMPTATSEQPPFNPVKVAATVQAQVNGDPTDQTGTRVPFTFQGHEWGQIGKGGFLDTDYISFPVVAGQQYFIDTTGQVDGSVFTVPSMATCYGGTSPGALDNGEGIVTGSDLRLSGTITNNCSNHAFGPYAIMGQLPKPKPAVVFQGDSITDGGQDGGFGPGAGGWTHRLIEQSFTRIPSRVDAPVRPAVWVARPGGTIIDFANAADNWNRQRLYKLATTAICALGKNDIQTATLANMKAAATAIANYNISLGLRHIQCTITPYTDSTDGWTTVGNQTVHSAGGETVRTGFNTWIRDGTFASTTTNPGAIRIFDKAAPVEVNAAGVLTLNGGFWMAPSAVAGLPVTGTLTAISSAQATDSSKTWVQDAYRGYVIRMTSGTQSGKGVGIAGNSVAGVVNLYTAFPSNPSIGDTFSIIEALTPDGVHMCSTGHIMTAQAFPMGLII